MKSPKAVFISHPVSGDIEANLALITGICRKIHSRVILPVFPSFTTRRYLTPAPKDRVLARIQVQTYINNFVDELWLFGDKITEGMEREIGMALKKGLPVRAKTKETRKALRLYLKSLGERLIQV